MCESRRAWGGPGWLAAFALLCLATLGDAPAPGALHRFYAVALSPDGTRIASIEADQPASGGDPPAPRLLIRDVAGGRAIPVRPPCDAATGCAVFSPVWAPDGRHLAFGVRAPGASGRTLYVADPDGGDLRRILAFDGTLVALRYAPDGRLAVLATEGARKEVGAARAGAPETGEIGAATPEQRIGIISGGLIRWASPPDLYVYEYDWLPDGGGFVGTAAPGDGDAHWWSAKLYAFDAARAAARLLYAPSSPRQQIAQPKVSPDGKSVSFIGGLMSDFVNPGGDAFVLPLTDAPPRPVNLTDHAPLTVLTLRWGCAPGHLIASFAQGAETGIADIDAATGVSRALWSGRFVLNAADTALSVSCETGTTAAIREGFTAAQEIVAGPIGAWRDVTSVNSGVTAPVTVASLDWTSEGHAVQGWLLKPAGIGPNTRLPLITVVHGGPAASYQPYFFGPGLERALLEHGYALFLPNPRGSYGQGEAFTQADVADLGHGDFRDILAGIDAAVRAGGVDPARQGITGVSYGGFMTLWATTQTRRFKAAVARAGISDWLSYYGENGIGGWLLPYFGASVYDDPSVYARSSPIGFVKDAKTPTLLMVGERDIECPPPQSREFWHALRELGTPTGFVIYPGEGHDYWGAATLSDAERRSIAWFDRYVR
jgi:dipeptidyl aminopeptidase/acylaminoacyl peptidase